MIRVVELFSGVGGFRLGLEGWKGKSASSNYKRRLNSSYKIIWSNQFEPKTKIQHASKIYEARFGEENHVNKDITLIPVRDIPQHDLLVGGFPCQDYSIAKGLIHSDGIRGDKGVLWWSIEQILRKKRPRPRYILLENVDRLLKSPSKNRGRDFAIMLKTLSSLGYAIEWRIINAANYGMPQKRKRIFIIGYHRSTRTYNQIKKSDKIQWLLTKSVLNTAFEASFKTSSSVNEFKLDESIDKMSEGFNEEGKSSPFENNGVMINEHVYTTKLEFPMPDREKRTNLGDILLNGEVTEEFYLNDSDVKLWKVKKMAVNKERLTKEGYKYIYRMGKMNFPDELTQPARTIITDEGGSSPARWKHIVKVNGRYRRLCPKELERLNMFPDDFTKSVDLTDKKRAFLMGNALVVGVVEKIGKELQKRILDEV